MKSLSDPYLTLTINETFLLGLLERKKQDFAISGNNDDLNEITQLKETMKCFRHLRQTVDRLSEKLKESI